jgi:hypothetical protein
MNITQRDVVLLMDALCSDRTSFILGAGASAPEVPVMQDLIKRVLQQFKKHVQGFVNVEKPTSTHYLFAESIEDETEREKFLISSISELRYLIAKELNPPVSVFQKAPCQYRLLSMVKPGMQIINYNVDKLASVHCRSAKLNLVHGEIPIEFVNLLPIEKAIEISQYGIEIIPEKSFWLPVPELESELLNKIEPAYRSLLNVSNIVVIGYSFGMSSNGMMDQLSFDALVEYCSNRNIRIYVVSPSPRDLAECLEECLKNSNIVQIPVYWNLFCRAILSVFLKYRMSDLSTVPRFAEEVIRRYFQYRD